MDNYYVTAVRMFSDAKYLSEDQAKDRSFNCCYLYGYVPECYGKIMVFTFLGMSLDDIKKNYRHSLKKLDEQISNISSGSGVVTALASTAPKYCLDMKVECSTIFKGGQKWAPENRYSNDTGFWNTKTIVGQYHDEAEKVLEILRQMKLDGVIE